MSKLSSSLLAKAAAVASEMADDESSASASHTHRRWRSLTTAVSRGGAVSRDDIATQFDDVRFADPTDSTRTIWHGVYDLADLAVDYEFYLGERDGRCAYSPPVRFALTRSRLAG